MWKTRTVVHLINLSFLLIITSMLYHHKLSSFLTFSFISFAFFQVVNPFVSLFLTSEMEQWCHKSLCLVKNPCTTAMTNGLITSPLACFWCYSWPSWYHDCCQKHRVPWTLLLDVLHLMWERKAKHTLPMMMYIYSAMILVEVIDGGDMTYY